MDYLVALLPVLAFLFVLIYLDSFKLIKKDILLYTVLWGILSAVVSFFVNTYLAELWCIDERTFRRLVSPLVEETIKGLFLVYIALRSIAGFRIDGAIYGFAVGTGFALYENIFFIHELQIDNIWLWIIRGFGTAIMHGGTTSFFGVLIMHAMEKRAGITKFMLFGWVIAVAVHSLYNHFILPPLFSMFAILVIVSVLEIFLFQINERSLKQWLELEFDSEVKLLGMITKGKFLDTNAGKYLFSIKDKFSNIIVFDMLAYISLYLELSIKAKSNLMLKEAGFPVNKDIQLSPKLKELKALERNIGKTGLLAISPILRISKRNLVKWSRL